MTEEEAKKKWCPMARVHIVENEDYYHNRTATGPAVNKGTAKANCIASACMMWRWEGREAPAGSVFENEKSTVYGYCGLAGKP